MSRSCRCSGAMISPEQIAWQDGLGLHGRQHWPDNLRRFLNSDGLGVVIRIVCDESRSSRLLPAGAIYLCKDFMRQVVVGFAECDGLA